MDFNWKGWCVVSCIAFTWVYLGWSIWRGRVIKKREAAEPKNAYDLMGELEE